MTKGIRSLFCSDRFKTKHVLNCHRDVHIRQADPDSSLLRKRKIIFCPKCDWSTKSNEDYARHLNQHNGVRPFTCEVCGSSFTSKTYLKVHSTVHTGEKPHECKQCDKAYRTKTMLNKHVMQKHGDERPFACELCPKAFKFSEKLRYHHQRAHSWWLVSERTRCELFSDGFRQCIISMMTIAAHARIIFTKVYMSWINMSDTYFVMW